MNEAMRAYECCKHCMPNPDTGVCWDLGHTSPCPVLECPMRGDAE